MMQTQILIMRPDEPHETRDVTLPDPGDPGFYTALRDLVESIVDAPMEHVNVFADFDGGTAFRYADMFVNECGHLLEEPLPRNEAATIIYRRNYQMHIGTESPEDMPWIAGPAVLFRHQVWR